MVDLQTSVTIPARMMCFLPVAFTAARKSALSQASTSPWRWTNVAFGWRATISFGSWPFGPGFVSTLFGEKSRGFFTGVGRRREDGWEVKEVSQRRVAEDGVSELNSAVVSDDCFEAGLMVYNEESLWELEMYETPELTNAYGVVLVQSFKGES